MGYTAGPGQEAGSALDRPSVVTERAGGRAGGAASARCGRCRHSQFASEHFLPCGELASSMFGQEGRQPFDVRTVEVGVAILGEERIEEFLF